MTLVDCEEFTMTGELLWFGLILHGNVHVKWSKGVRDRLRSAIRRVVLTSPWPVYTFHADFHDDKLLRFITSVGGVYDHIRYTDEGVQARMYRFSSLD